jgi:hypothetical protein
LAAGEGAALRSGLPRAAGKQALLSCLAKLAIGQVLFPMLLLSRWQLPHPGLLLGLIRKAKEIFPAALEFASGSYI